MGVTASNRKFLQAEKQIQSQIIEGHIDRLKGERRKHEEAIANIDKQISSDERRLTEIWDENDTVLRE